MKLKFTFIGVFVIALASFCNNAQAQVKKKAAPRAKVAAAPVKPPLATLQDIEDGKILISKSDCLTCHDVENKKVGPAYLAVAQKYPLNQENITALSQKILAGGSGVWGPIPMAPHPTITADDAAKMVKYVLSLTPPPVQKPK